MRIVFMGTPEFAVPSLEALARAGRLPDAVVTGPDRPRGRGRRLSPTPVKEAARRLEVATLLEPDSIRDPAFAEDIRGLAPDLIVVVAFRILPAGVFGAARLGSINLHGSLLPRYRGAAPIHRAIMAGERETGVTTFFLRERVDTGNVILQRKMPIGENETMGDVSARMSRIGADVVVETVRLIESGRVVETPQDEALASPAPKVFREEAIVRWDRPAERVHDFIRGLSPEPCAWTRRGGSDVKILRSRVADRSGRAADPGTVIEAGRALVVACGSGFVQLEEVQPAGRRRMTGTDFARGYGLSAGRRLDT